MASRTVTVLTDDLNGKELKDGEGQTVSFSVGRIHYEIDLSDKNLGKFYDVLKPYTDAARSVDRSRTRSTGGRSKTSSGDPVDNRAIRAWAVSNGIEVSARGRIPAELVERYRAAGN